MTVQFLIVADRVPSDLARAVSWRVYRARDSPFDPREVWSTHIGPGRIRRRRPTMRCSAATPPAIDKPRWAQTTRAYARGVATQTDGLLIDWVAREIVLEHSRPERATFLLADQWLEFAHDVHEERHRSPPTESCAAIRHETRGLVRFGLPDSASTVSTAAIGMWRSTCCAHSHNIWFAGARSPSGGFSGCHQRRSAPSGVRPSSTATASPPRSPSAVGCAGSARPTAGPSTTGSPRWAWTYSPSQLALPMTTRPTSPSSWRSHEWLLTPWSGREAG